MITERVVLCVIVLVGVALRAATVAVFEHRPESDEQAYAAIAGNVLDGHGVRDSYGNRAMYSPGYAVLVLAPAFHFTGGSVTAARMVNIGLGAVSIVLCYMLAHAVGGGMFGRLFAAALWAIYLPSAVYAEYLLKENLIVPLVLGVLWCAVALARAPGRPLSATTGALVGVIALVGHAAVAFGAAVLSAVAVACRPLYERVRLLAVCGLAAVLVVLPWVVRNSMVLGAPILTSNGGFNFYLGNNERATGFFVSIADTPRGPTWGALRAQGEVTASRALAGDAVAWIGQHPGQAAWLALRKLAYFWTPPWHGISDARKPRAERLMRALWLVEYLAICGLALLGLLHRSTLSGYTRHIWIGVGAYAALHMLFYVIFRYRLPAMAPVAVLAGLALEQLVRGRQPDDASWQRPGRCRE